MSDDDRTVRRAAGRRAHARGRRQGSGDAAGASAKAASASSVPTPAAAPAHRGQSKGYVIVAVVYLLGLFMGALDMGIVSPARVVIQNDLGIGDEAGVWIITIYSLAYAASIPVMGKLADKYGRKYVYLTCIFLFGLGSLLCGLSQDVGSYGMLIASRVVQAIGGGGIVPVATAEFGTAFPEEKRGMVLGLVGAVYGIASVFGSAAGSLILQIFGQTQWQFIFYINVPICVFVLIFGLAKLKNTTEPDVRPIDGVGICVMTVMILSLMYGLRNIDFFNLGASITQLDVWPYLVAFCVLVPVFVAVEHRAADPVMNLAYFKDRDILITLVCSIITGIVMMATHLLPAVLRELSVHAVGVGRVLHHHPGSVLRHRIADVGQAHRRARREAGTRRRLRRVDCGRAVPGVRGGGAPVAHERHRVACAHRPGHGIHHGHAAQLHDAAEDRRCGVQLGAGDAVARAVDRHRRGAGDHGGVRGARGRVDAGEPDGGHADRGDRVAFAVRAGA
jgi:MFS family permease